MEIKEFSLFIDALKGLPGISKKAAERIAYFLISCDDHFYKEFTNRLFDLRYKIKLCNFCNNLVSNDTICTICANSMRHDGNLCIVSTVEDLNKIESSNSFSGLYFVLNGELDHKNNKSVEKIDINKLLAMIEKFKIKEILIATNMTINGEITSVYLKKSVLEKHPELSFYRLALGLPINSSIDYIDWESLKFSIKNKTKMD